MTDDAQPAPDPKRAPFPELEVDPPSESPASDPNDLGALEEKTHAVLDEARQKMESTQADFESRLAALEQRANHAKSRREQEVREQNRRNRGEQQASSGLAYGMAIAYAIAGVPIGFYLIGLLIESLTGAQGWKNILTIVGIFLGFGYGMYLAQLQNRRS